MAFDVGRTRPEYGAEHPPPHARCARGRRVCSKIDQGGGAAARGPPTWCSGNGTASIQRKNTVSIPDTPSRHGPQASGSAQLAGDAGRPCVLGGPSRPPPITHRSIRYTNPDAQPADVLPCPARLLSVRIALPSTADWATLLRLRCRYDLFFVLLSHLQLASTLFASPSTHPIASCFVSTLR